MSESRDRVLRVGLTGGIASGKSTIANMFAENGVPIIDTDAIAREVVEPGEPGLDAIVAAFGPDLLSPDGRLDRRKLRILVFDNAERRHDLEAIMHPLIRARTVESADRAGGRYQLLVVPLLVETGFAPLVDRVLVVDCPEDQQRNRLLTRDGETPERIDRILAAQASRRERRAAADDVIDNTGPVDKLREQVDKLHARYLRLARAG